VVSLADWNLEFDPSVLRAAATGHTAPLVDATLRPVLNAWSRIPAATRERLGARSAFTEELTELVDAHLTATLDREMAKAEISAALRSRVDVLVRGTDIEDPARVQTLTISLRGADIEDIVGAGTPTAEE
jgi:hypothetical protein